MADMSSMFTTSYEYAKEQEGISEEYKIMYKDQHNGESPSWSEVKNPRDDQELTPLIPMSELSGISLTSESEEVKCDKGVQTEITGVKENTIIDLEFNKKPVNIEKLIETQKCEKDIQNYIKSFRDATFYFPPMDYDFIKASTYEPYVMRADGGNHSSEVKRQNIKRLHYLQDMEDNAKTMRMACQEIILTLISIINFQQVTIEEIVHNNEELGLLIDKYCPILRSTKTIIQRILNSKTKEDIKFLNNHISIFCFNRLDQEVLEGKEKISKQFLESKEYERTIKRTIIRCRNYLNSSYSKNVNKNRRIYTEFEKIFQILRKD